MEKKSKKTIIGIAILATMAIIIAFVVSGEVSLSREPINDDAYAIYDAAITAGLADRRQYEKESYDLRVVAATCYGFGTIPFTCGFKDLPDGLLSPSQPLDPLRFSPDAGYEFINGSQFDLSSYNIVLSNVVFNSVGDEADVVIFVNSGTAINNTWYRAVRTADGWELLAQANSVGLWQPMY